MKTQSTEKMRILALAQYYVERYNLPVDEDAEPSERYAKYVRSLQRLMEKKKIDGKSVWEIIKPKGKAREISIDGFESLFFADWSEYLKRQDKDDSINLIQLELDSQRISRAQDTKHWQEKAQQDIEEHNQIIEDNDYDDLYYDYPVHYENTNIIEVYRANRELLPLAIMIQAIYDTLYEPLHLDDLMNDLETMRFAPTGYNPEITPDHARARDRLENYRNYLGDRKTLKEKK